MEPAGTIVFASVGVTGFGFDVFSVAVPAPESADNGVVTAKELDERRHTDGVSINFNAQFADDAGDAVAFVSERTGAASLFLSRRPGADERPEPLPAAEGSLFHDRPTVRGGRVYFVSAHEDPAQPFRSWAAVYSARLGGAGSASVERVTPRGVVDMSPAVSASGALLAVASYGDRPWAFDFQVLETEVAVFRASDPARRVVVAARGGWPAWHGERALFFHRVADDGWWSVFRVDISPDTLEPAGPERRVTPPGLHCFTPAAGGGRWIAVATRRKGRAQRHVELFDLETERFSPLTERLNPELHHYNPFFSPSGARLGYHRFRGAGVGGESVVPYLQPVRSPVSSIRMLRVNGTFPSFSPDAAHLAVNGDFFVSPGVMVLRADGSRRWTLSKEPSLFYTTWSPTERGVVFTSAGPIFETPKATVRIARVEFDPSELTDDGPREVAATVRPLTRPEAGNDAFPAVSPCGRWLVFRSGRTGHKNLYVVDTARGEEEGGVVRRLTEGEWIDTMPSWSPDGSLIAFSSNRHDPENPAVFSIYLVRPDGSGLRRVYVAGPEGSAEADKERINHVCFSPDSRWLLFTANLGGVMAEPVSAPNQFQPYGDLYVCRLDGSGLRRLTCNAYENGTPAWGPAAASDGLGLESLALGKIAGEDPLGQFDEPLWLTCDV
ncbi:hypothetical protein U9M48_015997 [Paspalum notatum var. saurae]|uniref:Uncharacterized protein n=1 Tax=Paspalum notatum var. saurae TaxID=547442 RepID=A0AAQ3T659_PASNO